VAFSDSSQDLVLLGENVSVKDCEIGVSNWVGSIQLGSVATKATIESVVFDDNIAYGGKLEVVTGIKTNSILDNKFNDVALLSTSASNSFMQVFGGSNTSIDSNSFNGIEQVSSETLTFIEFIGSGESVRGLYVNNKYSYEALGGSAQEWQDHKVSGYADDGHEAVVIPKALKSSYMRGTRREGYISSATGTGTFDVSVDMIFPYEVRAYVVNQQPYFFINGIADGYSTSTTEYPLQVETRSVLGSGGDCIALFQARLPASTGFNITQIGQVYISVEKEASYKLNPNP
jgi:hypothetical protein